MISGWRTCGPTFCWIQLSSKQFRNSSWLVRIHSLTCCKICVKHQKAVMIELFTTYLRSSATYMVQTFRQPSSWSKILDWIRWHGRGAKRSLATNLLAGSSRRNRVTCITNLKFIYQHWFHIDSFKDIKPQHWILYSFVSKFHSCKS